MAPIVLNIRKSDIQQEIAQIEKANLSQMFFKKKGPVSTAGAANKLQEASKTMQSTQHRKKPVKSSLKIFG
jgi:hypothetical protein